MRTFKKLKTVFEHLPGREKLFVIILSIVFFSSLTQYFVLRGKIHLENNDNYFIEGIVGDIHYLNPLFADYSDADRDLVELIFSGLIRYDPVEKNFYPDLAENIERSNDGKKITFTLKENIQWHDGKPLTVDDIVYTYRDVIQSPGFKNPVLRTALEGVEIRAPDSSHIEFILPKANSYFISQLTVGILPKHIVGDLPLSELEKSSFNKNPIGSGPYRVVNTSFNQSGDSVSLHVFENYYGQKPSIEKLRVVTFVDEAALLKELNALDAVAKTRDATSLGKSIESSPYFTTTRYHLNQFTALYFNTDNVLLADSKIRKALSTGLHKNALIFPGEDRIDTLLLEKRPTDERFIYDAAKAEVLLNELGYSKNDQGQRYSPKGQKMILPLLALDKIGTELPTLIASQLARYGIDVPIQIVGEEEFTSLVNSRQYALLLIRQNLGYNRDVYPLFHSSQALKLVEKPTESTSNTNQSASITEISGEAPGLNFANFRSFRTDGLTEAIRKADIPQDKDKLLQELSATLAEETPIFFISTPVYLYAINKSIAPFPVSALDFHSDRLTVLTNLPSL